MCGIAGISLNPSDQKLNVRTASAALLRGIASRGPDATGAAWYDQTEDAVKLTKIAVNTEKFLGARKDVLPETTPAIILHTRYATTGDKKRRENNHPIHHGNIIGVHNGVLWDHEGMFKAMGRTPLAEVDSEAIFALLNGGVKPEKVLNKIAGDAAIGWLDLEEPEVLHLARVVDRPLYIAQTEEGSLMFASTQYAIRDAAREAGVKLEYEHEVEEAKYLKVVGGVIAEYLDIPGVKRNAAWSSRYAWTSGSSSKTTGAYSNSAYKGGKPDAGSNAEDWEYDPGTKTYSPVKKQTLAEKKAAAKKVAKAPKPEWQTMKTTAELVRIFKANGAPKAKAELLARGYDETGKNIASPSDKELVLMCKTSPNGHPWAEKQLSYRSLGPDGKKLNSPAGLSVEELVPLATNGSSLAVEALRAKGLDRTGSPVKVGV